MKKILALTLLLGSVSVLAQNPVIRNQFAADPTARVFDGRLYLYPSHDIRNEKNPRGMDWFCMADYHVFSSDNLTDWRDHGVIVKQEDVPWGNPEGFSMWAPDCVCKDGKYYFYFPDGAKGSRGGFSIGVAVADSPTGPFKIQENPIEGVSGIDPCVLQCSNGDAYIIWSGMGLRGAKLKSNMLELEEGQIQTIKMEPRPGMPEGMPLEMKVAGVSLSDLLPREGLMEGPFAFEKDGKFYLTYPYQFDRENNGHESLVYAMSDNPLGPYEYKGVIMAEHPDCWTNHHSIVEFQGQWYLFYHHNDYSPDFDKNRSACIDKLFFNEDGTIRQVTPTLRGVGLSKAERPIDVDRYSEAGNVALEFINPANRFEGWYIRYSGKKGSWSTYNDVDFGFYTPAKMSVKLRSDKGGILRVIVADNVIGEVEVPKKSDWKEYELPVNVELSGVKALKFELVKGVVDLDKVSFAKFSVVNPPEGISSENNVPGAVYPCVDAQGRATFTLYAPKAQEVAADICSKVYPMTKDATGMWKVTTDPLVVGPHYYRLIVDGVQVNDPNVYTVYGCGSCYSLIEIPEAPEVAAYYTFNKDIPHGQVRECQYWSEVSGRMRRCFVYTPAGYDSNTNKYPYFILQHGMAENETGWHEQGKMANIMDNNIASGEAVPMVVVMDNGDCDYGWGTIPGETQNDFGGKFESVVINDLIPYVEKNFRVRTDRENRAIAGLSWGGHQAFDIGLAHTELFSGIGAFSGAIFVFPGMPLASLWNGIFTDADKFNDEVPVLFMSNGTEEGLGGMALDRMLSDAGIRYTRYVSEGTAHEWLTWRRSLNEFVKLLFHGPATITAKGSGFESGTYRNVFAELGHSEAEIKAKLESVYSEVFEGSDKVYFEVGDDMGYVSDIKNHDVRTEGMSYAMMIAVQLGKKDVFDRIWRWSKTYMQHQDGPLKGYFAWSCNPDGTHRAEGPASDGELYYVTSLIFASNLWGNDGDIDYLAEAQNILNCAWEKDGSQGVTHFINKSNHLIAFTPEGFGTSYTDPSYHLPAFYEVWARWADDGRADFYRECSRASRKYLHASIHPQSGLNPDTNNFDGSLMESRWMTPAFRYDSWRVPMNIALDYSWTRADARWDKVYADKIENFFASKGIDTFVDQYNVDGSDVNTTMSAGIGADRVTALRHSVGLVATVASTALITDTDLSRQFAQRLWDSENKPYEDGYFDAYYDALLRLFAFMHLSGNYRVIEPAR